MNQIFICLRIPAFISILFVFPGWADWSYPGCDDVTDADFTQEVIIGKSPQLNPWVMDLSLNEPIEMALTTDDQGKVDIYFTERHGKLKFYDASENTVITIGTLDVYANGSGGRLLDNGFTGIVLSPDFKQTRWIYLFYTPKQSATEVYRISRFTLTDNRLDMSSEKRILEAEIRYDTQWHNGASMHFDMYGDLWIAFGKNCTDDKGSLRESEWRSCQNASSSTNSMRGGIVRIHPIPFSDSEAPPPGRGSTYTIPKGNFGDYFALKAENEGDLARAAEFRDISKVLPEVFAKGTRNAWTATVEPVRRWVAWGENGINRGDLHEEHNITRVPGFFGFPYFAGNPEITTCPDGGLTCDQGYDIGASMLDGFVSDPQAPENNSKFNTGLKVLPPAIPSIFTYRQNSAMTGPIYRYDGDLVSDVKFPPHFHHGWFLFDFNRGDKATNIGGNQNRGVTKVGFLNETLDGFTDLQDIFQASNRHYLYGPIDIEMGPDGAMYIINYAGWFNSNVNTNISRFIYTGDCRPAEPRLEEKVNPNVYYPPAGYGCTDPQDPKYDANALANDPRACSGVGVQKKPGARAVGATVRDLKIYVSDPGEHIITIVDLAGRETALFKGRGRANYDVRPILGPGIHFAHVSTPAGTLTEKLIGF